MSTVHTNTTCVNTLVLGVMADFVVAVVNEIKGGDISSSIGKNNATSEILLNLALDKAKTQIEQTLRNA